MQARLSEPTMRRVMLTAHRYTAPDALAAGLIDGIVPENGSEATIRYAITKATEMAPLAESGVSSSPSSLMVGSVLMTRCTLRRSSAR